MKNIKLFLVVSVVLTLVYSISVKAVEQEHIQDYVPDNLMWKWYGTDWSTGTLPKVEVDDSLEEGVDYTRSWAFTRNLVGNVSELNYLDYEEALQVEQLPGSVCEKITGLGNYLSEKVVCHTVYGYTYIKANDLEKNEGEIDPELTYKIFNYNNLEDDMSKFFNVTIERKEGEEPGEYELIPKFELKNNDDVVYSFINNESLGSIQFLFNNLGRIIVQPLNGKLTIKEKNNEDIEVINEVEEEIKEEKEEEKNIEEYISIPHTDIYLNYK